LTWSNDGNMVPHSRRYIVWIGAMTDPKGPT